METATQTQGAFQAQNEAKYPTKFLAELLAAGEINREQYERLKREFIHAPAPQETPAQQELLPCPFCGNKALVINWQVLQPDGTFGACHFSHKPDCFLAVFTGSRNHAMSSFKEWNARYRDPAFHRLVKTLDDLCGFLNVTPLRLNEGDSMTLSMLTDSAREALHFAREETEVIRWTETL